MSFSFFRQWIGPILPALRQLEIFNWSEPLFHKELFEILQWAAEQNPSLVLRLSTNGTTIDKETAERLISSPVQVLTITMAGLTKEDYCYYHGVDSLEKVIHSLRVLAAAKKNLGSSTPRIRVRYLRFSFNLVSSARVRRWVKKHLGSDASFIDRASVQEGYLCGSGLSEAEIERVYHVNPKGHFLVSIPYYPYCRRNPSNPAIRADGAVFPCCSLPYREEYIMGFLGKATFQEIWEGPSYSKFRESLIEGKDTVCKTCFIRIPRMPLKLDRHFMERIHSRWRTKRAAHNLLEKERT
jgi:radical SAM protein with 4Fe4S-binding SPASM domain